MAGPQPLEMFPCNTPVPTSVRNNEPVGHTSRHAALVQCLQTSLDINHRISWPGIEASSTSVRSIVRCSMNATWRHVDAPRPCVLSYDMPVNCMPSSGTWFHSLQATSQALQPMQMLVSVKNPTRRCGASAVSLRECGVALISDLR